MADDRRWTTLLRRPRWWGEGMLLTVIFVAWTGVGVEELIFGLIAGGSAATARQNIVLHTPVGLRLSGIVRFVPYFLHLSFHGGVDVARRVLLPSFPIEPGFVEYGLRVDPDGPAAVFFGAVISLVPGTLCVELEGEHSILVHVVDIDAGFEAELQRLERRVAAIFRSPDNEGDEWNWS